MPSDNDNDHLAFFLLLAMFLLPSIATRPLYPLCFRLARSISSIDAFERAKAPPLSPERTSDLRQWAAAFRTRKLDKSIDGCDVRFDRAGGAGGQVRPVVC